MKETATEAIGNVLVRSDSIDLPRLTIMEPKASYADYEAAACSITIMGKDNLLAFARFIRKEARKWKV